MDRRDRIADTRLNLFYDEQTMNFDLDIAQDLLETDSNIRLVLYRVDHTSTQIDDVYGESKYGEVLYKPPIELIVIPTLLPSITQTYNKNNGSLRAESFGNLEFTVLERELTKKSADITYGDIIGYAVDGLMTYFSVSNPNYLTSSTQILYGKTTFYRRVKCVVIDKNDFNGI
jgi:hypothetical protein